MFLVLGPGKYLALRSSAERKLETADCFLGSVLQQWELVGIVVYWQGERARFYHSFLGNLLTLIGRLLFGGSLEKGD